MARPTPQLDDLRAKKLLDAIRRGNSQRNAAVIAGVSWSTYMCWKRLGRKGLAPYAGFLNRIKEADVMAEEEMISIIRSCGERWQAAAWWLERTNRVRYRRPVQPVEREPDMSDVPDEVLVASMDRAVKDARRRKLDENVVSERQAKEK